MSVPSFFVPPLRRAKFADFREFLFAESLAAGSAAKPRHFRDREFLLFFLHGRPLMHFHADTREMPSRPMIER